MKLNVQASPLIFQPLWEKEEIILHNEIESYYWKWFKQYWY